MGTSRAKRLCRPREGKLVYDGSDAMARGRNGWLGAKADLPDVPEALGGLGYGRNAMGTELGAPQPQDSANPASPPQHRRKNRERAIRGSLS